MQIMLLSAFISRGVQVCRPAVSSAVETHAARRTFPSLYHQAFSFCLSSVGCNTKKRVKAYIEKGKENQTSVSMFSERCFSLTVITE